MTKAVEQIVAQIDALSLAERADVARAFLASLEPLDEGVAEAWEAELAQRLAEIRAGTATGKPAEQLFNELRERRG